MNKLLQRSQEEVNKDDLTEDSVITQFFGIEPQKKIPATVDFRLADNTFRAVPYSYIMDIEFDPADGIEVLTSTKRIKIRGRNLRLLYDYLAQFRVRFIQANVGADLTEGSEPFVSSIEISSLID